MEPFFSVKLCDGCADGSVSIIFTDEESLSVTYALKSLSMIKAGYSIITGKLDLRRAEGKTSIMKIVNWMPLC